MLTEEIVLFVLIALWGMFAATGMADCYLNSNQKKILKAQDKGETKDEFKSIS